MMGNWRRNVIRIAKWLPAASALIVAALLAGLGLHAIRDWHHHGEPGAGLFHLHFHVGHHDHETKAHDHRDRDRDPDPTNQQSKFYTVAMAAPHAAASAPETAQPVSSSLRASHSDNDVFVCQEPPTDAAPRAPPA
jgi:hypothetical protein